MTKFNPPGRGIGVFPLVAERATGHRGVTGLCVANDGMSGGTVARVHPPPMFMGVT